MIYGRHMETNPNEAAAPLVRQALIDAERSMKWTAEKAGIPLTTFKRKLDGHGDFTLTELGNISRALSIPAPVLIPEAFRPLAVAS